MKTKVIVRVTGRIARITMPASARRILIDDDRHQPFQVDQDSATTNVMMSKWHAVPEFFSQCKFYHNQNENRVFERLWPNVTTANEYVYMVNVWLTIVNYFGLDVQYRKEFVEQVRELKDLIPAMAFRRHGEVVDDKRFRFHHKDYTLKEMRDMFSSFFKWYGI